MAKYGPEGLRNFPCPILSPTIVNGGEIRGSFAVGSNKDLSRQPTPQLAAIDTLAVPSLDL